MSGPRGGGKKVLLPPINFIFKLLQSQQPVQIWLFEQLGIRIEGKLKVHLQYRLSKGARFTDL